MAIRPLKSLLTKTSNCTDKCLLQDYIRICLFANQSQVRNRRRSSQPPDWYVKKKGFTQDVDISQENTEFLQEVASDSYSAAPVTSVGSFSPLKEEPWARQEWNIYTRRAGVLALKIGVIPQWTKDGKRISTTMLQILDNHVIRYTPPEKLRHSLGWKPFWKDRFGSLVVGSMSCDPHMFTKAYNNLFAAAGVPPKRKLTRFVITPNAAIEPGTPLNVMHFKVGDYVDCQAKTIDYGFQGVVKRWGMKGMPATHGTTKAHRKMGATGGGGDRDGIYKGKKMPGHMGSDWRVSMGMQIVRINTKYNVLYVKGQSIPGENHAYVRISDTRLPHKKNVENPPSMPTFFPEDTTDSIPEEIFHENLFQFSSESMSYPDGDD